MTANQETANKDDGFIAHTRQPLNGGPPLAQLREHFITPIRRFFVRSHAPTPASDESTATLRIDGLARHPLRLSVSELVRDFPPRELTATLQCAGNRRDEMLSGAQMGAAVAWGSEAIGNARWQGVRLADVLAVAGPLPEAAHLQALGRDDCAAETGDSRQPGFGGSIPLAKALAPETLLAYGMNGEALPPLHGGPLRLLIPGYIGARSVKWLARLTLAAEPSANHYQARSYKVFPPEARAENADWQGTPALGELWVNAVICLPAPGRVIAAGPTRVAGYAHASAPIAAVELSADGGLSWQKTTLTTPAARWSWRFWETVVELTPGEHELVVRARDERGNEQPPALAPTWNFKGYRVHHWQRRRVLAERRP